MKRLSSILFIFLAALLLRFVTAADCVIPKTGDSSRVVAFVCAFLIAAAGLTVSVLVSRKHK